MLCDELLGDELTGGKFDSVGVGILKVRGASEFEGSLVVSNGKSDFLCDEVSVGSENGGTDDKSARIGI